MTIDRSKPLRRIGDKVPVVDHICRPEIQPYPYWVDFADGTGDCVTPDGISYLAWPYGQFEDLENYDD